MYHTRPPMGAGSGGGIENLQPAKIEPDWTIKEGAGEFEKENDFVQFFKYIQGHHSCTHSSMIGPSDHRIPRSGKFDVTKPEALQKLYAAVSFFYRQGKPLVLCEIATSKFRFFEDVDLILSADLKNDLPRLQGLWIEHLLRHRAAVLGAVWRSDDPLGVKCRYTYDTSNPDGPKETARVHVFSSSGWSSRHHAPKISLHFVWPDLVVTPREAKGIRGATIEFLRESCSPELSDLLKGFAAVSGGQDNVKGEDLSPWEEIFDRAATEGTSLRLVWCDKGVKADLALKSSARLEGRPKVPIGTFTVPLIAGDPTQCGPELKESPTSKTDLQWLLDASIRLDGSLVEIPNVSNVWLSTSQTKGLAGINLNRPTAGDDVGGSGAGYGGMGGMSGSMDQQHNQQQQHQQQQHNQAIHGGMNNNMNIDGGNGVGGGNEALASIKKALMGKFVDMNSNWMTVEEYKPSVPDKLAVKLDATSVQIAELIISPDVYSLPINIEYVSMDGSGKSYRMNFHPGNDKYGTFFPIDQNGNTSGADPWMWRHPAVAPVDPATGVTTPWPNWAEFVLIEIAGHADAHEKSMGLAAIICAVSNVPTSGKVHGEAYWKGHMSFSPKDFESDNVAVNVPLATVAAVVFGLKAVLDLREKIGGPKIKGIFISSDHTVVEAAVDGQSATPAYLEAICKLLVAYKNEILEDEHFPNCFNFAVSKISAASNKAAKLARDARIYAQDDEFPACSMGDIELHDSVVSCCEAAATLGANANNNRF